MSTHKHDRTHTHLLGTRTHIHARAQTTRNHARTRERTSLSHHSSICRSSLNLDPGDWAHGGSTAAARHSHGGSKAVARHTRRAIEIKQHRARPSEPLLEPRRLNLRTHGGGRRRRVARSAHRAEPGRAGPVPVLSKPWVISWPMMAPMPPKFWAMLYDALKKGGCQRVCV
jgi:hypothetical protein